MPIQINVGTRPTKHLPNTDDDLRAFHALRGGQLPREPVSQQLPRGGRHTGLPNTAFNLIANDNLFFLNFVSVDPRSAQFA